MTATAIAAGINPIATPCRIMNQRYRQNCGLTAASALRTVNPSPRCAFAAAPVSPAYEKTALQCRPAARKHHRADEDDQSPRHSKIVDCDGAEKGFPDRRCQGAHSNDHADGQGRNADEEHEAASINLRGAVEDFAESHRPELVAHCSSGASDLPSACVLSWACGLSSGGGIIIRSALQRLYSSRPRRDGVISKLSVGR